MSDSKNEKMLTVRGVVTEALPSTLFRVQIEDKKIDRLEEKKPARNASPARNDSRSDSGRHSDAGGEILAYLSGKMRMHRIKVLIGDSVEIVLDPYGGKGRIVKRL